MAATHHKSSEVREAIQTLSCILSNFSLPKFPSEVFRRAKFNKPGVSGSILQLLYHSCELLIQLVKDPYTRPQQLLISTIQPTLETCNKRWMLFAVRKFMKRFGYIRNQFYCEENSRELLLALGWVIVKHGLIVKLRKSVILSINIPLLPMKRSVEALLDEVEIGRLEIHKEMQPAQTNLYRCQTNALHKLVWINGRIISQLKNLNRSVLMHEKLSRYICSCTSTEGKGSLELYEVFLLRHKELISKYILELEKKLSLLQSFSDWEKLSPVFAKWLNSILDLEEEEKTIKETTSIASTDHKSSLSILNKQVQSLQSSLETFIIRNKPFLEYLQTRTSHSAKLKVSQEDLECCIHEVKQEIFFVLLKKLNCVGINHKERLKISVCSFVEPTTKRERTSPWLHDKINELQKQIDSKRKVILQQLQILQDTVPDAMAITLK